jgi:hypothetical protein
VGRGVRPRRDFRRACRVGRGVRPPRRDGVVEVACPVARGRPPPPPPVLLAFDDDDKTETYAATARPQVHGIWSEGIETMVPSPSSDRFFRCRYS